MMSLGKLAGQPALSLRGVAVGHSKHPLVQGIDLDVMPGEIVSLIGPNGSGKTTTLRTVAAQLHPLAGSICLLGHPLQSWTAAERARIVAALFTSRPRVDLLTARDVVEAGRYPYTSRLGALNEADGQLVRKAMEDTDTWNLRNRDVSHMSDGQRQRVFIARALVQQPRVLLLDEPTSYLDIRSQIDILQLLRDRAREQGIAVLATLHDLELAQRVSDTVVCIREGHVWAQGPVDTIFTSKIICPLYDLDPAAFNETFGSVELSRPQGGHRAFVLIGHGDAAPFVRALQRAGIPFAAGIAHPRDVDAVLAKSLAAEVIFDAHPDSPDPAALQRALELIDGAEALTCPPVALEEARGGARRLLEEASRRSLPLITDVTELGRFFC